MKKIKSYLNLHLMSSLIVLNVMHLSLEEAVAHPTVNVPLNHNVYKFVERFEAKGLLSNMVHGIRPYSRQHIANILKEIRAKVIKDFVAISVIDLSFLKRFLSGYFLSALRILILIINEQYLLKQHHYFRSDS